MTTQTIETENGPNTREDIVDVEIRAIWDLGHKHKWRN